MKTLKEIPFKERKPIFKKLEEIADLASLSKEERRLYDADIRAYRDRLTELGTVKRDGEKIGERRGVIKGRIEGERRGEKNKQLSIARNLKEKGLPVTLIVETTGLSAEEVENL